MASENDESVSWDGEALIGWITVSGERRRVRATRDVIHAHAAGFNDAVTWEIERFRTEIFEKLRSRLSDELTLIIYERPRRRRGGA